MSRNIKVQTAHHMPGGYHILGNPAIVQDKLLGNTGEAALFRESLQHFETLMRQAEARAAREFSLGRYGRWGTHPEVSTRWGNLVDAHAKELFHSSREGASLRKAGWQVTTRFDPGADFFHPRWRIAFDPAGVSRSSVRGHAKYVPHGYAVITRSSAPTGRTGYLHSRVNTVPGRFGGAFSFALELFNQRKQIWHNASRGLIETGLGFIVFNERLWKSELAKMPPLTVLPGHYPVKVAGQSWISDVSSAERVQAGDTIPLHNFVWWKDYDGSWHFTRRQTLPTKLAEAYTLAHRVTAEQRKPSTSSTSKPPQATPLSSGAQAHARSARAPQKLPTPPGPNLLRQLSQGLYEANKFSQSARPTPGLSTLPWMAQGLMPKAAHRPESQLQLLKHALMHSFATPHHSTISHSRPLPSTRPAAFRSASPAGSQLQLLNRALMRSFASSHRPAASHSRPLSSARPTAFRSTSPAGSQLQLLNRALMRSFSSSHRPAAFHSRPLLSARPSFARHNSLRTMSRGLRR